MKIKQHHRETLQIALRNLEECEAMTDRVGDAEIEYKTKLAKGAWDTAMVIQCHIRRGGEDVQKNVESVEALQRYLASLEYIKGD